MNPAGWVSKATVQFSIVHSPSTTSSFQSPMAFGLMPCRQCRHRSCFGCAVGKCPLTFDWRSAAACQVGRDPTLIWGTSYIPKARPCSGSDSATSLIDPEAKVIAIDAGIEFIDFNRGTGQGRRLCWALRGCSESYQRHGTPRTQQASGSTLANAEQTVAAVGYCPECRRVQHWLML